jgi:predicted MFS family arabinose efflux permease
VPGIRALVIAIGLGLGVGVYVGAWLHWPTFLAVAIGAVMAIVLLLLAASLGEDPAAADAAWREAAPDLVGPPPRTPGEPAAGDPPTAPRARP